MRVFPALILPAFLAIFAVPRAPAGAAGFDCAKAATPIEKRICADPALSALDDQLTAAYKAALAAAPSGREAVKADQRAWLITRDACPDDACLKDSYADRTRVLTDAAKGPGANANSARVTNALKRREALYQRLKWPGECEEEFQDEAKNETSDELASADEGGVPGVAVYPLAGKTRLAVVTCGLAAYQTSFCAVLFDEGASGPGKAVTFTEYGRDPSGKVEAARTEMTGGLPEFDSKTGTLTVLSMARGVGDCGCLVVYGFDGGTPRVLSAKAQACFDDDRPFVEPENWPPVKTP